MKFGILASHQYPRTEDLQQRLGELWELTEYAAELGYDSVFSINHFLANLHTPQIISMTAKLIEHSGDMQVGTSILLLPFFHPIHIAEEFATLDQLSGGRMILGVGAGYRSNEFEGFNLDKFERIGRMREGVELIRKLWADEPVEHQGTYYPLDGQRIGVPPVQPGGPEIWIGGGVEKSIRRSARIGDAWLAPGNSPDPTWLVGASETYRDELDRQGKDAAARQHPVVVELFVGPDEQRARETCRPYIQDEYFAYSGYSQLSWQKSAFETLWDEVFLIGGPDEVAEKISWLEQLGFGHVIFRPFWTGMPIEHSRESVRLLATEVMPRFR